MKEEKDYKDFLLRIAEGKESDGELILIKNIINKLARTKNIEQILKRHWEDSYEEDIISELREKLIKIKESIQGKERISFGYVNSVINTSVIEFLKKNVYTNQVSFSQLENSLGGEKEFRIENSVLFAYYESKDRLIEGEEVYKRILEVIKPSDYPVVCYYFCKQVQEDCEKPEGISQANLYKRWERLRKKIAQGFSAPPSQEAFEYFFEKFLSEVCQKLSYKKVKGR